MTIYVGLKIGRSSFWFVEWIKVRIQVYAAAAVTVDMVANNQECVLGGPQPACTQWQGETPSTLPGIKLRYSYSRLGTVQALISELHRSERTVTCTLADTG